MRYVSNQEIKNYIKENFNVEEINTIAIHTIVFEDGFMGTSIHVNDEMLEFNNDVICIENDMIELQNEIKEIGIFIYKEYEIVAEVSLDLFGGMATKNFKSM